MHLPKAARQWIGTPKSSCGLERSGFPLNRRVSKRATGRQFSRFRASHPPGNSFVVILFRTAGFEHSLPRPSQAWAPISSQ
jgi:hypothetical protein